MKMECLAKFVHAMRRRKLRHEISHAMETRSLILIRRVAYQMTGRRNKMRSKNDRESNGCRKYCRFVILDLGVSTFDLRQLCRFHHTVLHQICAAGGNIQIDAARYEILPDAASCCDLFHMLAFSGLVSEPYHLRRYGFATNA